MQRFLEAKEALSKAYREGRIRPGSCRDCVISVLIEKALGYPDADWGIALECHLYNLPLPEGIHPLKYYADLIGYSVEELIEIEGAFEGVPRIPGVRRISLGRDESVKSRLDRVFWTLEKLEKESTPQEETVLV